MIACSTIRIRASLLAGLIAISFNTLMLKAAHLFGIVAENGGLLRLHVIYLGSLVERSGIAGWWIKAALPGPNSLPFWLVFHYATGMVMVFLYTYVFESRLPSSVLVKGSVFSLLPWLINGLIVLPLLGQGPLGLRQIAVSGAVYFFVANWVFGATLAVFYEKFRSRGAR